MTLAERETKINSKGDFLIHNTGLFQRRLMLQFLEEWGDENKYLNCKFSRGQTNSIKVKKGSHTLPQVLHFKCLGTIIYSNEEINGEGKICSSYMTRNFVWC